MGGVLGLFLQVSSVRSSRDPAVIRWYRTLGWLGVLFSPVTLFFGAWEAGAILLGLGLVNLAIASRRAASAR